MKAVKLLHSFYEPQMKVGKPIYFSPTFTYRLFLDPNTKKVMLNHSLMNKNVLSIDIRKDLMYQKPKTHPMIYMHDDQHIVYTT